MADNDSKRGIYGKYIIKRSDGSHRRGRKHEHCSYYVLDLKHDKYAPTALRAYADACESEYPDLAADLRRIAKSAFPSLAATEAMAETERRR